MGDRFAEGDRPEVSAAPFRRWLETPLGEALLAAEAERLEPLIANLFGYYLVQVGCTARAELLAASRIKRRVVLGEPEDDPPVSLRGSPEALPFASANVDAVALLHVLEFADHPHEILRETYRVLIPEGRVIITGFNPWSLWGVRRQFTRGRAGPWGGHFRSVTRLRDWLALLGFELDRVEPLFYRPPLQRRGMMARLEFLERYGPRWWPGLGGAYLLVARKRVIPLTPVKPRWRPRRGMIPSGLTEPTTFESY